MNQRFLNHNNSDPEFVFTNKTKSDPQFTFKNEAIKPAQACRYLGFQIDSYRTISNGSHLGLTKMSNALGTLNLTRNQMPSEIRFDVFKSVYPCIFLLVKYFFKLLQQKHKQHK